MWTWSFPSSNTAMNNSSGQCGHHHSSLFVLVISPPSCCTTNSPTKVEILSPSTPNQKFIQPFFLKNSPLLNPLVILPLQWINQHCDHIIPWQYAWRRKDRGYFGVLARRGKGGLSDNKWCICWVLHEYVVHWASTTAGMMKILLQELIRWIFWRLKKRCGIGGIVRQIFNLNYLENFLRWSPFLLSQSSLNQPDYDLSLVWRES